MDSNGSSPFAAIEARWEESTERRLRYELETDSRRREYAARIEKLQDYREQAMTKASEHAGNIGLIYNAKDNDFTRVVILDTAPHLPERPALPALAAEVTLSEEASATTATSGPEFEESGEASSPPIEPEATPTVAHPLAAVPVPPRPERPALPARPARPPIQPVDPNWLNASKKAKFWSWVFSTLVGSFVGIGLISLAGFGFRRPEDRPYLAAGILIGIAAIGGIKFLFDQLWYGAGRRNSLAGMRSRLLIWELGLSAMFIGFEAFLGGTAIVKYSEGTSFAAKSAIPFGQAVLVAMAVSTATLVFSAVVGYQAGERSVTEDDVRKQEHERDLIEHERKIEAMNQAYEEELAEWRRQQERVRELEEKQHELRLHYVEEVKASHQAELADWSRAVSTQVELHQGALTGRQERVDEFESVRKLPDFQSLCKYIGIVNTLNLRIAETERQLNNELISRGHGRKNAL